MATYSFLDVTASLTGPTGVIDLGQGSANSEEGITQTMGGNKNTMTIGADGEVGSQQSRQGKQGGDRLELHGVGRCGLLLLWVFR